MCSVASLARSESSSDRKDVEALPEPLTRLSTTGLLGHEAPRTIERWIEAACAAGLLRVSADLHRGTRFTTFRDHRCERGRHTVSLIPKNSSSSS